MTAFPEFFQGGPTTMTSDGQDAAPIPTASDPRAFASVPVTTGQVELLKALDDQIQRLNAQLDRLYETRRLMSEMVVAQHNGVRAQAFHGVSDNGDGTFSLLFTEQVTDGHTG
jgi:hypothetical protein